MWRPLVLLLLVARPAAADDFLRQHALTRGFMLGRPVGAKPTPDGKSIVFLRAQPRDPVQSLYELDVASGQTRELCTPASILPLGKAGGGDEQLSPAERARRERMRVSTRGFTAFDLSDDGARVLVTLSGRLHVVERASGRVRELKTGPSPAIDPRFSPDGRHVAYVRDRDLYVYDLDGDRERRLTTSAHPRVTNGLAEFVAQEEMDRFSGFWWSPDSRRLAYEQADSRPVETFRVSDVLHPESAPEETAYPRAGTPNAIVRLGVIPVGGGATTWVGWDAARLPYLAQVVWKDGPLTLVVVSREQHDLEVLAADENGRTRRLIAEHDDAWLNLDPSVPRWLPGGHSLIWTSEGGGMRHLELRNATGGLERVLGYPTVEVDALVDIAGDTILYTGKPWRRPTEQHLFRARLYEHSQTGALTQPSGRFSVVAGKDHATLVVTATTLEAMPRATVMRFENDKLRPLAELPSVAETPPWQPRVELVEVGKPELEASLTRPRNFVAGKKYPVVVDVYGGPHHQQVTPSQGQHLLRQWIADHGYVVVAIDGRGTPGRGRAWERAIAGSFARVPLEDQVAGLTALGARYPELDLTRVGVFGWSFGGYLAALAVLKRPDVFSVAVAGAPVVDWRDYDTFYTERYLGLPEGNPTGYEESSLLTHAPSLRRPLLLVHGTRDDNVYFFHTLKLCDALFRAGRPFQLLPLPGLTHMVPDPVVKEQLYTRIADALGAVLRP
jgi:dipeptidyl-peptidase-4